MNYDVERFDLIVISLIYNYLANASKELSEEKIEDFINVVEKNLKNIDDNYEVVSEKFGDDYLIFKEADKYILRSLNAAAIFYDFQANDVITATLQDDALNLILVDRDNLKLEKCYQRKSGVIDVFSLEAKRARESAINFLNNRNCTNIIVCSTVPDQLEGDKGYHVTYVCDEPFYKVKI